MFSKALIVAAVATIAAAQSAVLTFTKVPNPVTDGQAQAITYSTNDTLTPVTIILRKGPAVDKETITTLTTEANGGQYIWTPSLTLPNGQDYYLDISQATQNNTFGPFTVQGFIPSAVSANSTTTSTGSSSTTAFISGVGTSMGTGTALPRNTTMSRATLTVSQTATVSVTTATTATVTPTGGAASVDYKTGGLVAALFGAAAAALI